MPLKLLLDTNVWLDYYLPMRMGHESAKELVRAAEAADADLFVAIGSLKDFSYLLGVCLKRELRRDGAEVTEAQAAAVSEISWAALDNLMELATIVPADTSDAWIAQKRRPLHGDFEDDLVIAATLRLGADYLVSSDESLLLHAPVAALSPQDMAKLLRAG